MAELIRMKVVMRGLVSSAKHPARFISARLML